MSRLLLVSNRLPVAVKLADDHLTVAPSTGGLATGLRGLHEQTDGRWLGWPGDVSGLSADQRSVLDARLAELKAIPLHLTAEEVSQYYEGFANGVLWPLFHYLVDRLPLLGGPWEAYRAVNERFAALVVEHHRPGDLVWVHDYQLMLVPMMVRRQIPDARIGFFLHIPFPSPEVFRTLPRRRELLEGLLGADLVGFHTFSYARHFARSLVDAFGLQNEVDHVAYQGRRVEFDAFPMGIDAARWDALAVDPEVNAAAAAIRAESGVDKLIFGVDRLDYTKGIPRRLLAFEQLLRMEPSLREHVQLIQLAVPSRTMIAEYEVIRGVVDQLVGRINGELGTVKWAPIHYLFRSVSEQQLAAMYRAADVMLVTPLRDGMNLVAKEFVAARSDERGVLVLSEFAGAAYDLGEALLVNPYDVEATAATLRGALLMSGEEQRIRMRALRERVRARDIHHWANSFIDALAKAGARTGIDLSSPAALDDVLATARTAERLVLLLDYDGTLAELRGHPALASPDEALRELLAALARRPHTRVHLVSGRRRDELETWFGTLPIGLHAEHGLWSRMHPETDWHLLREVREEWKSQVRPILERFTDRTPGSLIEEKTASLVWHHRMTEAEFGARQAKELLLHLEAILTNLPVEVLAGSKVVEIRLHGVHKGTVVPAAISEFAEAPLVVAIGDDRTDDEMFQALPPDGIALQVGPVRSRARHRVADPAAVRKLLWAMVR